MSDLGLVLSGGGARGAYQAGVLKGVSEICELGNEPQPFSIVTGVSVGALNAAFWAASQASGVRCAADVVSLWENVRTSDVYRADVRSLSRIGLEWSVGAMFGALLQTGVAESLLDTSPLRQLLERLFDSDSLRANLESGHLSTLTVSATDYATSNSITFVDSARPFTPWQRGRRQGRTARITVDHLMASAAIPLFFPPVKVGDHFYGDGCLRNTAPMSPAIHLGARRLLVVGVRHMGQPDEPRAAHSKRPSVARILSVLINAVLLDGTDVDVEALRRNNEIVEALAHCDMETVSLNPVDFVWVHPSEDIARIALEEARHMPRLLRYLLGGLGTRAEAAELISYLLFEPPFCRRLIDLGYRDAMAQKDAIRKLVTGS